MLCNFCMHKNIMCMQDYQRPKYENFVHEIFWIFDGGWTQRLNWIFCPMPWKLSRRKFYASCCMWTQHPEGSEQSNPALSSPRFLLSSSVPLPLPPPCFVIPASHRPASLLFCVHSCCCLGCWLGPSAMVLMFIIEATLASTSFCLILLSGILQLAEGLDKVKNERSLLVWDTNFFSGNHTNCHIVIKSSQLLVFSSVRYGGKTLGQQSDNTRWSYMCVKTIGWVWYGCLEVCCVYQLWVSSSNLSVCLFVRTCIRVCSCVQ